jgi:hypothetical protein
MDHDAVRAAAANHASWCDLVCRTHGIETAKEDGYWVAQQRPPEPFTDAVTLLAGAPADDVLRSAQNGPGSSVTDSFCDLDLAQLGFVAGPESRWLLRGPVLPTVTAAEVWSVVETEDELADWARVAKAPAAFRPELLSEPTIRILVARGRDGIQAGAVIHRSGRVVGLCNLFMTTQLTLYKAWTSLPTAVAGHFPWTPIAGCVSNENLAHAQAAGFADTGSVRVWSRPVEADGEDQ